MNQSLAFSQDLFILTAAAVLGLGLLLAFKSLLQRAFPGKGNPIGYVIKRTVSPLIFLLLVILLRSKVISGLFKSHKISLVLEICFLFFLAVFFVRLMDGLIVAWYFRRRQSFPLPRVFHSLILFVIYGSIFFLILKQTAGISLTPFLATSALLTMILGLAFQGVLSNVISGISLHFTRSFSKGNWVKIGDNEGFVTDTNWRETRLIDRFGNQVVIPNNFVAAEKIVNFSLPAEKTALKFSVKLGFDAPAEEVTTVIKQAVSEAEGVLPDPAPLVYMEGYDNWGISYQVKYWITDFSRKFEIQGTVGRNIWYGLNRRGFKIPGPWSEFLKEAYEGFRGELPSRKKVEIEMNLNDLKISSFLKETEKGADKSLLTDEELRQLAAEVKRETYASQETVFRQGEQGECCYVVGRGKLKGEIHYLEAGKDYSSEFIIERGGLFGEMSLFTGMLRTATVKTLEETVLLKIDALTFANVLNRNPELAEKIAKTVSLRNRKNKEFFQKIEEISREDIKRSTNSKSILSRLKKLMTGK